MKANNMDQTTNVHAQVQHLLKLEQPEQRSEAWFQMRSNLLTASNVAAALGIKPYPSYSGDPREDLICKMVSGTKVSSPFLQHGVDFEDEAISELERATGEKVRQVGLFVHPKYSWLGGSPDGLTESGCTIEAKCPQSRQIVMGEVPHHYFPQVQVCMEICDLDYCWFVEYKPSCLTWPKAMQLNVVKIARDRQWFADNLQAMHSCWLAIKEGKDNPDAFWASRKKKRTRAAAGPRKQQLSKKGTPARCPVQDNLYGGSRLAMTARELLATVFP
jgi:putative phage-type endonuclease